MCARPVRRAALGKLSSPRLGRVFDRRRLFDRLDALREVPGIWLAAPPGAGKTTLLATWLRRRADPALWLRVDADDADPATFAQSLDALCTSLADGPVDLPAFRSDDLADLAGWLRRRVRFLLPQMPQRWTLVLDNQQTLPASAPLQAALAAVLDELPDGVQWIFASRMPPPPAYARALAGRQLQAIDADELRFDAAETRALIELHGHAETMAEPLSAANGWAAGMTLMLLGGDGAVPAQAARGRLFDYFADEVLLRMPESDQRTLGLLALLPSTTAELAVAMSEAPDAPELLERLAAASLFTDRRGDAPTVYVFHALFGEFLCRRLERSTPPEAFRALQLRAGRLLLAAGDFDAGLQRLIDGHAWVEAQAWIRRSASRYVDAGRVLALQRRIEALPAGTAEQLAYWRGVCAIDTDPAAALADMQRARDQCRAAGDARGQLEAAAGAATVLLGAGRLVELDAWIELLDEHAGALADPGETDAEMRIVPGLFAALTHRRPWHPLAEPLAERAERLLYEDSGSGQRLLLGALAFHFLWRGQLDRLERIVLRIDALCGQGLAAPATLMRWWSVGILVKVLTRQADSAAVDARRALALIDGEPLLAPQRAHVELLAFLVALGAGDVAAMRQHLRRAAPDLHPDRADERSLYEHERGMLALIESDRATALQLMPAAVRSARAGGSAVREHIALISHALAAAVNDRHDEALAVLEEVRAHPIYPLCRWHHWSAGCVAAYAALRRGDRADAEQRLRLAFAVARECGYRYSPLLKTCAELLPTIVAFALSAGIEPEVARDLVARHALRAPPDADEHWPWSVRVRVLGRLEVEIDGAPMASPRKESRRLLELLRLIAAHGAEPIGQDRIADTLWPDADGDAARNSLDNALHRLRKLLGGDDRVLLQHGALRLNPQRCWVDVVAVERCLDCIAAATAPELPALLDELRRLCRAPLLPDDGFGAIEMRRRTLQRKLRGALSLAAERLEAAGGPDAARGAREGWDEGRV